MKPEDMVELAMKEGLEATLIRYSLRDVIVGSCCGYAASKGLDLSQQAAITIAAMVTEIDCRTKAAVRAQELAPPNMEIYLSPDDPMKCLFPGASDSCDKMCSSCSYQPGGVTRGG